MANRWGNSGWLYFGGGSKITADGNYSHEIKRYLLLGRKVMTNLDSILKSRDITLPTKVHQVKAIVFPVVMYGCESWTIRKAECWALSQLFHSPLSLSSRGFLVLLHFLPEGWCHLHIWGYWYFSQQPWFQLVLHPEQHFTWCTLHISWVNRMTILFAQLGTSLLFHVQFLLLLLELHTDFSGGRSGIPISWRIFHSLLWPTQSKALV